MVAASPPFGVGPVSSPELPPLASSSAYSQVYLAPTYSKNQKLAGRLWTAWQIQDLEMLTLISSYFVFHHSQVNFVLVSTLPAILSALSMCTSYVHCSISLSGLRFTISIIAMMRRYKNALIMLHIYNYSLNIGDIANLRLGVERGQSYAHFVYRILYN
jgi:hypothetical protein